MLGIAPPQFFPDFEIGVFPETGEIGRQLDRLVSRRQQFHQDRLTPFVHPRRLGQPEALLQPDSQDREFRSLAVFDADAASGRDGDMGGRQALYGLLLLIAEQAPQDGAEIDFP